MPYDAWWQTLVDRRHPGVDGVFIHPVSDRAVMAGNGTIGLEILEDLPDVDAVLIPYGGGGLSCGIASALRALRPQAKVYACEVETAAPLHAALQAGAPVPIALPMVRLCSIQGDELGTAGEKRNSSFRFTLCKTVSLLGKYSPL